MNDLKTYVDLNVFNLGSHDLLIGINWLDEHRVILNCYNKTFLCTNDIGNVVNIKGIPKIVFVREISTLQIKKCVHKGCKNIYVHIIDIKEESE
jgi:hypothetical protein